MRTQLAYIYIALAAALWGIIGLFVTYLYDAGFTPTQVVTIRAISTTVFLLIYIGIKNRKLMLIKLTDSKYFIGTGVISIVCFNLLLFTAIQETSISVAAILLYTAPAFVTILSRILFKEYMTPQKIAALFVTLLGCSLVVGVIPNNTETISLYGFLLGIGAGFFYALYSVFGKFALKKYTPITVTLYTFVFAAIAITPFSGLWTVLPKFLNLEVWLYIIGLGFLSTMMAFILYTKGLDAIETSRASIIATLEPVVAAFVGFLVFQEQLHTWQYLGILLVISAVILVQKGNNEY
ncbi:DMT family transporter [Desulfuribacillus alkaliarsenatis]|uniref:Transporter n=1 Tax=Desulfuribacillus alkaliarsenatis TaxID=766136 RepID=A0A1E5G5B5_9FIRM|nr:DMT family transporter [Desulfuribacillus alkaliarsenatis]OEF98380.1 transporter [Desulfuribacillus alkaliarsenatis]